MPPSLSVIVPALDEAERIAATLAEVRRFVETHAPGGEVIVVDDGSTDGTRAIAEKAGARVLAHTTNRGKGAAVRTGMLAATGARRLFTDVDLSAPLEEALRLAEALDGGADVAVGSRLVPGAEVLRPRARGRATLSQGFHLLTRRLAPEVADTQCGFKMLTAAAAHAVFARTRVDRYAFDVELLVVARRQGLRVSEVPIRWRESDGSRVRPVRDGARMLSDLARIAAADARGAYK